MVSRKKRMEASQTESFYLSQQIGNQSISQNIKASPYQKNMPLIIKANCFDQYTFW